MLGFGVVYYDGTFNTVSSELITGQLAGMSFSMTFHYRPDFASCDTTWPGATDRMGALVAAGVPSYSRLTFTRVIARVDYYVVIRSD